MGTPERNAQEIAKARGGPIPVPPNPPMKRRLTKREFVDEYRNEVYGMLCEATVTNRTGTILGKHLADTLKKLDALLDRMYDQLSE